MPKKKAQRNGFYFYMQDLMQDLRKEGRVFPNGMADVVPVAHPRWKLLPPDERERYDRLAKEEKQKNQGKRSDSERLDNVGNIIAKRLDPDREIAKRRIRESKITKSRWAPGNEIIEEKFYFISFEYMIQTEEGEFRPMEVGLVEFSLKAGITKSYHTFIDPGSIPLGYRFQAQSHSDDTHQIPIKDFKHAERNYRGIWIQLENFINPSGEKREYPALFTQNSDLNCTEACLDWLHAHATVGYANRLTKVFELENMVVSLYAQGGAQISMAGAMELLSTSAFDYEPNTRCKWHEDNEVKHCALGTVKRFAYALADSLADIYDFELLPNSHLPEQPDGPPGYVLLPPDTMRMDYKPIPNKTTGYGPATGSVPWNRNTSSAPDNGPFGARDIRYTKPKPEEPEEPEEQFDPPNQFPETMRRPNIPGYAETVGPWRSAIGRGQAPPAKTLDSDWPSLVGDSNKAKYAGRSAPSSASIPPPPSSWQNVASSGLSRQQGPGGQPYVEHVVEKTASAKPTIHQAVKSQSVEHAMLPQRNLQPTSSTQDNAWPVGRPVNVRGRPPRTRGARGGSAARAPGYQPPLSDAAFSGIPSSQSAPGFGDNVTVPSYTPPTFSQTMPAVSGDEDSWPSLGLAGSSNAPVGGIGRGRGVGVPQAGWQMPGPGQGLGRGRGIWNLKANSGTNPGNTAPRAPPGFGRGLVNELASMNLSNPSPGTN